MKDYKKILEGVVDIINNTEKSDIGFANICTYIGENCPELKESEDEKIRKELIDIVKKSPITFAFEDKGKVLAWLEKQVQKPQGKSALEASKEEKVDNANKVEPKDYSSIDPHFFKPTDKVEPKFKIGDKIQYLKGCGTIMTIEKIENGEYIFGNNLGHTTIESGNKWHLVEQTSAWSKEDENMLDTIIDASEHHCMLDLNDIDWLKSLKYKVQPKQEWSALDERNLQGVIDEIQANKNNAPDYDLATYDRFLSWLKFLKDRYTWKPSDEQMNAFDAVLVYNPPCSNECRNHLITLYNELKKLREE